MSDNFVTALKQFGDRMACIQCTRAPNKKKRKGNRNMIARSGSSLSDNDLPKFILCFSSAENSLSISAFNLTTLYRIILSENELRTHLRANGFEDCPWNRYFVALNKTFLNPLNNIKLIRGKGGGYMIINISYPIQDNIILTGELECGIVDQYSQHNDNPLIPSIYKKNVFMNMFKKALNCNHNNNNDMKQDDDDIDEDDDLQNDNCLTLKRKIEALKKENNKLRLINLQNINNNNNNANINSNIDGLNLQLGLTQNINFSSIGSNSLSGNNTNSRIRKQRNPSKSLMNPRRAKKRKIGLFSFNGSKKK